MIKVPRNQEKRVTFSQRTSLKTPSHAKVQHASNQAFLLSILPCAANEDAKLHTWTDCCDELYPPHVGQAELGEPLSPDEWSFSLLPTSFLCRMNGFNLIKTLQ